MNAFLIEFDYDGWCQGPEKMRETALVYASSYDAALIKLKEQYSGARNFKNKTVL